METRQRHLVCGHLNIWVCFRQRSRSFRGFRKYWGDLMLETEQLQTWCFKWHQWEVTRCVWEDTDSCEQNTSRVIVAQNSQLRTSLRSTWHNHSMISSFWYWWQGVTLGSFLVFFCFGVCFRVYYNWVLGPFSPTRNALSSQWQSVEKKAFGWYFLPL